MRQRTTSRQGTVVVLGPGFSSADADVASNADHSSVTSAVPPCASSTPPTGAGPATTDDDAVMVGAGVGSFSRSPAAVKPAGRGAE